MHLCGIDDAMSEGGGNKLRIIAIVHHRPPPQLRATRDDHKNLLSIECHHQTASVIDARKVNVILSFYILNATVLPKKTRSSSSHRIYCRSTLMLF